MGKSPAWMHVVLVAGTFLGGSGVTTLAAPPTASAPAATPDPQELLERLGQIAKRLAQATDPAEMAACNLQQAELMGYLAGRTTGEEKLAWLRRMADCLIAAALDSPPQDRTALVRLARLEESISRHMPGTELAAYVTYQEMQARHTADLLLPGGDLARAQRQWQERLRRFVTTYPKAQDAPAALLELGQACEFLDQKEAARECYRQLAAQYPENLLAARAEGAYRRLDLEGKVLHLTLPLLRESTARRDAPFDLDQLRGKVVVVYFWASCHDQCRGEFQTLKELRDKYAAQGMELLCVNLDAGPEAAQALVQATAAPGIHVFQRGGLEGRVALRYGLMVVPSLLLVGPDGKVVAGKVDLGNVESAIQKQMSSAGR